MLTIGLRRHDPRHFRQRVIQDVALQLLEQRTAVECATVEEVGASSRLFEQRAARLRVLILQKIQRRGVAEIADEWVIGKAFELCWRETQAHVLIKLPRDACGFEPFRIGQPVVTLLIIVDHRSARQYAVARAGARHERKRPGRGAGEGLLDGVGLRTVLADPSGPHIVAIRVGRTHDRAMVVVAHGEGIRQRIVERDIAAFDEGHRLDAAFGFNPVVIVAAVPGSVRIRPVVRQVADELVSKKGLWRTERQQRVSAVRLLEYRVTRRQSHRARIIEAAHPAQRSQIMIERAILLHQHHDVLHVLDRTGDDFRFNAQGAQNRFRKCGAERRCSHGSKDCASICFFHLLSSRIV